MKKKHGMCCIIIGTMLLIAALSLVICNYRTNKIAEENSGRILSVMKEKIPKQTEPESTTPFAPDDLFHEYETQVSTETITEEALVEIENDTYIGYISIPELGIELPVMSEWSYDNLKISPCRYKGTAAEGDIIIAAHNYNSHFGRLNELSGGEEIVFTAADGKIYNYEVIQTESISGKDVEAMEFGSSENWDLTLFTCTLSGQSRVTIRAILQDNN